MKAMRLLIISDSDGFIDEEIVENFASSNDTMPLCEAADIIGITVDELRASIRTHLRIIDDSWKSKIERLRRESEYHFYIDGIYDKIYAGEELDAQEISDLHDINEDEKFIRYMLKNECELNSFECQPNEG